MTQTFQLDRDFWVQTAYRIAAISGIFLVAVALLLAWDFALRQGKDPLDADRYREIKADLAKDPESDSVKSEIRALDLGLREDYFRHRAFTARGAWLLLGGCRGLSCRTSIGRHVAAEAADASRRAASRGHRGADGLPGPVVGRGGGDSLLRLGVGSGTVHEQPIRQGERSGRGCSHDGSAGRGNRSAGGGVPQLPSSPLAPAAQSGSNETHEGSPKVAIQQPLPVRGKKADATSSDLYAACDAPTSVNPVEANPRPRFGMPRAALAPN